MILLEASSINNRKNISKKDNYCHILSHFYWNEKLQKETFGGRTTARTVFPLAMVRTSKRKLFQTQFISMSKHSIEERTATFNGDLEPLVAELSDQRTGTELQLEQEKVRPLLRHR